MPRLMAARRRQAEQHQRQHLGEQRGEEAAALANSRDLGRLHRRVTLAMNM